MQSIKIGHVDVYIVVLPLGTLLRWGFFTPQVCRKAFCFVFIFSHSVFPFRTISLVRLKKQKVCMYVLFVLGKYKLNGIHISYALSLSLSRSLVNRFVLLRFAQNVSTTFIFVQLLRHIYCDSLQPILVRWTVAFLQIFRAQHRE